MSPVLPLSSMNFKLCSINISACNCEFKRTETLSKCIPNVIQSEKVNKVAVLFKSSQNGDNVKLTLRK